MRSRGGFARQLFVKGKVFRWLCGGSEHAVEVRWRMIYGEAGV